METEAVVEAEVVKDEETPEETPAAEEHQEDAVFDVSSVKEEDVSGHSDEELDELIENLKKVDESVSTEETVEGADTQEKAGEEAQVDATAAKPESEEAPPEGKEAVAEESAVETISVPKEEWEKSQRHMKSQDEFEQRRSTEVGTLRSENQALRQQALEHQKASVNSHGLSEADRERINAMEPADAQIEMARLKDAADAEYRATYNQTLTEQRTANQAIIERNSPTWTEHKDGIEEYIGDLISPEDGRNFVADPASQPNGGLYLKMATDVVMGRKQAADSEAKIKDLEGKLKTVTDKIAAATNKPRTLGNMGSGSNHNAETGEGEVPEKPFHEMSDAELDKHLPKDHGGS